jgi:hypothetical protein
MNELIGCMKQPNHYRDEYDHGECNVFQLVTYPSKVSDNCYTDYSATPSCTTSGYLIICYIFAPILALSIMFFVG